jgi:glycosyltransferase involved in cell wall biosynthesis
VTIGYVVTALGSGGTEHGVELAAGELVRHGHKVAVIAEHPPHGRLARLEELGATVHGFEAAAPLAEYARILRHAQVEIVHLHVWERTEKLSGLGRAIGVPVLLSYQHVPPPPWRTWGARVFKPWRIPAVLRRHVLLARNIDAHVACCHLAAVGVRGELWPLWQRRVHCVPNGVPVPEQISEGVRGGAPRFLQVGALVERKDPEATLRAFAELSPDCPDAELTFVGDGPLRNSLEISAVRLGRDHRRIRLVGQVDDPRAFYAASNISVLPSQNEGLPYALLEAAGHGLALIATDVGGNREVAVPGRTGLLVPAGDPAALAQAMNALSLNPALRTKMGRNARALVQDRFTIESHVRELLTLYTRLLQRRKPLPPLERGQSKSELSAASSRGMQ